MFIIKKKKKRFYLEGGCGTQASTGLGAGEGEGISQAASALSAEPDMGLDLTT